MKNNDNRGISQDDLDEFSRSESEIMREVARRKAIGEANAKKQIFLSLDLILKILRLKVRYQKMKT